jgi:hypothetical protein
MAKNSNGILWKVIAMVITLTSIVGGIIYGYASLNGMVAYNLELHPKVQLNTEYRLRSEVDTKYIKEKIENIELMQRQILEEVRK